MNRRSFLRLLAAAPIAALAPWRPPDVDAYHAVLGPVMHGLDLGAGESRSCWLMVWGEEHQCFALYPRHAQHAALTEAAMRELLEDVKRDGTVVYVDEGLAALSGDPDGYVAREIALSACLTGAPAAPPATLVAHERVPRYRVDRPRRAPGGVDNSRALASAMDPLAGLTV